MRRLVALLLSAASALVTAHSTEVDTAEDPRACTVDAILVPSCRPWLGAYVHQLPGQSLTEAVTGYEQRTGSRLDIVHVYLRGDEPFPTDEHLALAQDPRGPRILFFSWKPDWGHSWAAVADGAVDARLDRAAERLRRRLPGPFFLTIHHEPENEVRPWRGSGYTAADYAAMFRHVVERLREQGVHHAVTVMNYMGASRWAQQPWYAHLYPGDDVVDWIGFDRYATDGLGGVQGDFADLVGSSARGDHAANARQWPGNYVWARRTHPGKPLMLAEWGVGEHPGDPLWKAGFLNTVAPALERLDRLHALVYFSHGDPPKADDTRPTTSAPSAAAFRAMVDAIVGDPRIEQTWSRP